MNESTKNSIISALTSILLLASGIPAFSAFLTPDLVHSLQSGIPTALGALSTLITVGLIVFKAIPKSKASIVRGAAQLPEVAKIVTTPDIAAKMPAQPEVVTTR